MKGSATTTIAPQRSGGVPGLYVGSGLAFKADCVNVDIIGIMDARGVASRPGELCALVAREAVLSETEPRLIYFLQHNSTERFPFDSGRFRWINSEREWWCSGTTVVRSNSCSSSGSGSAVFASALVWVVDRFAARVASVCCLPIYSLYSMLFCHHTMRLAAALLLCLSVCATTTTPDCCT